MAAVGKDAPFGLAGGWPSEDPISKVMSFVSSQPQLIVCGLFGLDPITYDERRELLGGVSLYHSLETVACVQAQWDVAYSTTRGVRDVEGDFLAGGGEGGLSEKVLKRIIIYGDMLISPRATAQLQREIIEYASTDHAAPAIDRNTLTQLLLSITTEQNLNSEFAGDVPTTDEIAKLQHKLPKMGLEELHEYAKPLIQGEIASALFNAPLRLEIVLSNTYDLWFTKWAPRSKTTGLGATPAEAFKIATEVELIDIMRLGLRIIKRTKNQQVRFSRDELLADGASEAAIDYLFTNMALKLDDFKTKLQEDRNAGEIGHQRYPHAVPVPRHQRQRIRHHPPPVGPRPPLRRPALLRSVGQPPRIGPTSVQDRDERRLRTVRRGHSPRIVDKCPHLLAIADEPDMQAAWTQKKGVEPSVCDWLILGKDHCVVIDATNHAVKEDAAQGLATWKPTAPTSRRYSWIPTTASTVSCYPPSTSSRSTAAGKATRSTTKRCTPRWSSCPTPRYQRTVGSVRHQYPKREGVQASSAAGVRTRHRSALRPPTAGGYGKHRGEGRQEPQHDGI